MNGIVSVGTTYGIMTDLDNVEDAWDFMKYYFFSEDAFNNGAEYHAINPYKFCEIEKFYNQQLEDIKTPPLKLFKIVSAFILAKGLNII